MSIPFQALLDFLLLCGAIVVLVMGLVIFLGVPVALFADCCFDVLYLRKPPRARAVRALAAYAVLFLIVIILKEFQK